MTGISIGTVKDQSDLIAGIVALLPHKVAVLLLLSTMLIKVNKGKRLVLIAIFSSALPLGILLAGLVSGVTDSQWVMITLEAIGAGAVFHVAMLEMLPEGKISTPYTKFINSRRVIVTTHSRILLPKLCF